jgi:hypothetical protein
VKRLLTTLFLLVLAACGGGDGPAGTLQFLETSFDASEGTVVNILVARSGGRSGVVSVDYVAAGGTAVAGVDYPVTNGTLTYAAGVSGHQTISIPMTDDNTVENIETLTVTLSNVSRATLGANASATVNIIDDDRAMLPITADNARAITADVLEAITSTIELVDILDFVGIPVIAGTNPSLAKALAAVVLTETVLCDTGEATVTWNDVDNDLVISTGDTFDVLFVMCFFADTGTTLDGATSLTDMIVTGDSVNQIAPWRLETTIGFDNLAGTDAAGTVNLDGSLDLDLGSSDNVIVDLSIGTASLTARESFFDYDTLTDYVLIATFDLNALTEIIRTSGTLAKPYLPGPDLFFAEGTVTFETLQDFTVIVDDNPSAGQLLISDSSSSVLVTVLDNINVQLEIDLELDGTIDQTIVVPWSELDID